MCVLFENKLIDVYPLYFYGTLKTVIELSECSKNKMSEDKKRQLKNRMQALHEKYCQQLPQKYHEIEDSWNEYRADLSNPEFIETFYRLVHTLKGTAATFGFVTQADICFEIQKSLLNVIEDHSVLPSDSVELIQQHLNTLKDNINSPAEKTD